jgi:integrase
MGNLTTRLIANAPDGMHSDGYGLYLKVKESKGTKAWIYRYQLNNIRREMGIGSFELYTLNEARNKILELRKQVKDGVDPIEDRKQKQVLKAEEIEKSILFKEAANEYILQHKSGWSNTKHSQQWPNTMRDYVFPFIGSIPVAALTLKDVLRVLTPIWETKTETASRIRARIEKVIDWCIALDYKAGDNPARWTLVTTQLPSPKKIKRVKHHTALSYYEINQFMIKLRNERCIAAYSLEFLIQTASRTGEVINATWDEFDLEGKTWIIPEARMKARKEHRVPLNESALKILAAMKVMDADNRYIFPGGKKDKPQTNMSMAGLLKRLGVKVTVHGFRSCFKDWAAEQTSHPNMVSEMALAHAVGGVEGAYRRGDLLAKRAKLMDEWNIYINTEQTSAFVVDLTVHRDAA